MSDQNIRAALRGLTPEDVPFVLDLLERLSGMKWKVAPEGLPSIEELLLKTHFLSIGHMLTGRYDGHSVAVVNRPGAEREICVRIREKL